MATRQPPSLISHVYRKPFNGILRPPVFFIGTLRDVKVFGEICHRFYSLASF